MQHFRFKEFMVLLFLLTYTGLTVQAQEPTFEWAKQLGGSNDDEAYDMATDSLGNVYTIGRFYGTSDYNPGPGVYNLVSAGQYDVFVSKVDAAGNFVWAKHLGGSNDEEGKAIAVDDSGNVIITGYFSDVADFDPGAGVFNMSPIGSLDIFIVKLNASGNFIWAKQLGGPGYANYGRDITVDKHGNIYLAGSFSYSLDFDPGAGVVNKISNGSSPDIFILKLNASGEFIWVKQMGGNLEDAAMSIIMDNSGNIFTTGYFTGIADFDPGAAVYNLSSLDVDAFVSKLDSTGNFVWAKQLGGSDYTATYGQSITLDNSGNIYTTGYFKGIADFDPGTDTFNMDGGLTQDVFISKLNASGDFAWAKQFSGPEQVLGASVAIDNSENVYTTGTFMGTADFDPGAGTYNLTSAGEEDIFISKLDASGNFVWTKQFGSTGSDYGTSIAHYGADVIYTSGYFRNMVDFNAGNEVYNLTSAGIFDVFLHKMSPCNLVTSVTINGSTLTANATGVNYQWIACNNGNQPVPGATSQSFSPTSNGEYAVVISQNSCKDTSDCYTVNNVGVREMDLGTGAMIYPNPTSGNCSVFFDQALDHASVTITNLMGITILAKTGWSGHQLKLNLSNEANGIYFLQVRENEKLYRVKIVKD